MSYFASPSEALDPWIIFASRRFGAHHVVLRSKSPVMKHTCLFADQRGGIYGDLPAALSSRTAKRTTGS